VVIGHFLKNQFKAAGMSIFGHQLISPDTCGYKKSVSSFNRDNTFRYDIASHFSFLLYDVIATLSTLL
jgi:hypothetical protein